MITDRYTERVTFPGCYKLIWILKPRDAALLKLNDTGQQRSD